MSSAFTSTLGMIGSLPEHTIKAVSGLADGAQITSNILSGGRIAPSALNPMLMDDKNKQYNSRTVVSQATDRLQGKIDKNLGADKTSFAYKASEFVAPLLVPTKGAKGGSAGAARPQPVKPPSTAPLPTVTAGQGLNNIVPFVRLAKPQVNVQTGFVPRGGNTANSRPTGSVSMSSLDGGARLRGAKGVGAATLEAPTRLTSTAQPVVAKLNASPRQSALNRPIPLAQNQIARPAAPLTLPPRAASSKQQKKITQAQVAPVVLPPKQAANNTPLTTKPSKTRPIGDPAPSFPQIAPAELNPADKPQRRGNGDAPIKPGGGSADSQKAIKDWLTKQAAKNHGERLADYSSGRISRGAALSGLSPEDRAKMNDALDKIDSMRLGGKGGGSGASSGTRSTADVKKIWHAVDAKGGVNAMPEPTVRQLKGITEQALKAPKLSDADRAEFGKRLSETQRAQTKFHQSRQAQLVQRNQASAQNPYLPGESFDAAKQRLGTAFNAKDYLAATSTARVSPDEFASGPTWPTPSAAESEAATLASLLKKHGLDGGEVSAEAARVALANTGLYGPTTDIRVMAQWVAREHPHLLQDSPGEANLLGKEVAEILRSGDKPGLPSSLKEHAHSDAVKWPRFNKAEFAKDPSSVVTEASLRLKQSAINAPRIVEYGPGGGAAVRRLLSDNPSASATLVGVDPANLTRLTQAIPADMASRVTTLTGDASKTKLGQGVDLIVAERLLPHMSDADATQLIQNASASLKPGGELIVDFYTTDHLTSRSRNAEYRDAASINKIIGDDFVVSRRTEQTGLISLVLVKKSVRNSNAD